MRAIKYLADYHIAHTCAPAAFTVYSTPERESFRNTWPTCGHTHQTAALRTFGVCVFVLFLAFLHSPPEGGAAAFFRVETHVFGCCCAIFTDAQMCIYTHAAATVAAAAAAALALALAALSQMITHTSARTRAANTHTHTHAGLVVFRTHIFTIYMTVYMKKTQSTLKNQQLAANARATNGHAHTHTRVFFQTQLCACVRARARVIVRERIRNNVASTWARAPSPFQYACVPRPRGWLDVGPMCV